MPAVRRTLMTFGIVLFVIFSGYIFVNYYKYIFAREVKGVIVKVQKVEINVALMQTDPNTGVNPRLHSFAVAIKEDSGEIVTASAEDRQWAVAQEGQCAEAVYYPYPPWDFEKSGTYHGARLEKLMDCK